MKPNIKKLLILNAPYLLFVYLFDKVGQAVRLSPGADLSGKLLSIGSGFSAAFSNALPSFAPMDLLKTLLFDKAIEYARIPEVKHTANKWQDEDNDRHTISNRVYKMSYHVYENTRYDKAAQKSIPYSYTLSWNVYTNSPHGYGQAKIAGQDRKVFADRAAMEKYLNGRIKAYEKLFTEISPAIPPEYAEQFRVNGQLLPG